MDAYLHYRFPLAFASREEVVDHAERTITCGREEIFVLLTNRRLTAEQALSIYRSRNAVETAFRDLKHGIDWRPARCTSSDAIRGCVLISFLALFCMSMARFLYSELPLFSFTVCTRRNGQKRRIIINFGWSYACYTAGNRLPRCRRHQDRRFWAC